MKNLLEDKVVLLGPYVGNIKTEIITFWPFVNGFKENFKYKNLFISTHENRTFLYDDKVIPIFKIFTNDRKGQRNHTHKKLNSFDYKILKKHIIEEIVDISDYKKTDIISYDIGYNTTPNVCITQKSFNFLPLTPHFLTNKNILIVPIEQKIRPVQPIYEHLVSNFDNIKLLENSSYKKIFNEILAADIVVTPSSHGTLICNLYKKRVFSWGRDISLFKEIYNFNNDNCYLYYINGKLNDGIYKYLYSTIKKWRNEKC